MNEWQRRREALLEEIAFLQRNLDSVERDRRRVPWLFVLPLAAIPAGIFGSGLAAIAAFVGGFIIAVTGVYLVGGHRSDYRHKLAATQRLLEEHDRRPH